MFMKRAPECYLTITVIQIQISAHPLCHGDMYSSKREIHNSMSLHHTSGIYRRNIAVIIRYNEITNKHLIVQK